MDLSINKEELRVLEILLDHSYGCCDATCTFQEMVRAKTPCKECDFTRTVRELSEKVEQLSEVK